jgi:serine/threonine protein kinase
MAPEIVRGEALPSTKTDRFSLAVLLFYMFMFSHPLEGRKEYDIHVLDAAAMTRLYGLEPVFIFDPADHSNEPVKGFHDNALIFWNIYPQFLRDLFTRSFTVGLKDPVNGRVLENEWRAGMVRLRDSIFYCPHCDQQNFYDVEALKKNGGKPPLCWNCKKEVKLPFRLRINDNIIMLNRDTRLYPHHIDNQAKYDFSYPVAEVTRHPTDPNLWGLKNLTQEKWIFIKPDGSKMEVETGRNAPLTIGAKINFGRVEGEVRY